MRQSPHPWDCPFPSRKPKLYSRIFLGTSKGQGHPCLTATKLFHNSPNQSGLACSVETPLILTMSSPISTPSPMMTESIKLGKHVELLHGTSAPAKTVRTHGGWVITWEALVEATLFIFGYRHQELSLYGKPIQCFFTSLPVQFHS